MEIQMEITANETTFEARLTALEDGLAALATKLDELTTRNVAASATTVTKEVTNSRKTLPTNMTTLLAKQGVALDANMGSIEAGSLDQALLPLSIEQRIAVKAQLLRAGLLN